MLSVVLPWGQLSYPENSPAKMWQTLQHPNTHTANGLLQRSMTSTALYNGVGVVALFDGTSTTWLAPSHIAMHTGGGGGHIKTPSHACGVNQRSEANTTKVPFLPTISSQWLTTQQAWLGGPPPPPPPPPPPRHYAL